VLALFYFVGTAAMFLAIDSKRQPLTTNAVLVVGLGVFAYQGIRALSPDQLSGGRADKRLPGDFDPLELAKGIEVELEHTSDRALAREIAMDHLVEDPHYYDKLIAAGL